MNKLEDMVCYSSNGKDNISDLFWGKYKLESENATCGDCNVEPLLKYDGIVLPVGLYYLQNFKTPKLNYKVEEQPIQDNLLDALMDLNTGGSSKNKSNKKTKRLNTNIKRNNTTRKNK